MILFYINQRTTVRMLIKSLRVSKDCKNGGKLTFLNVLPRRRNLSLKKNKHKLKHHGPWALNLLYHTGKRLLSSQAGVGSGHVPGDRWKFCPPDAWHLRTCFWGPSGGRCARVSTRRPVGESVFPWADGTVLNAARADSAHGPVSPTCRLCFTAGRGRRFLSESLEDQRANIWKVNLSEALRI